MQDIWVQSLGQEDPLEKEMANHSSILAWEVPQKSLVGYSPWGPKRVKHNLATKQHNNIKYINVNILTINYLLN